MTDDFGQFPEELRGMMKRAVSPPASVGGVPAELDAAIVREAEMGISRRRRVRRMIWAAGSLSAAACLVIVGGIWFSAGRFDVNDVNRDGRVTIADAFSLARKRAAGDTSITQERIDQLAMASVRLDGGEVVR